MSIESKTVLLREIEQKLRTTVTAAEMDAVMTILADQMAGFDVEQVVKPVGDADECMDSYLTALRIAGRSDKTVERYRYVITRMMADVAVPTRQITVHHLRGYLAREKDRGVSDSTLEGVRQCFSAYFNWLQREGLITGNPTANLVAIRVPKVVRTAYSDVDLEKLRTNCKSDRDNAIIAFLRASGCRISEMTALDRDQVDLTKLEVKVHGKGDKERIVYLDPVAGMLIKKYLDSRTDTMPALFVGKGTERLAPGGVRNMLRNLGATADVVKVHPHRFRRTLATTLSAHGMPIEEIAQILGHDKLDTTRKYIEKNAEDVKHNYRKYSY